MELHERIAGSMYGLLIGDALGVPYEFTVQDQIPTYAEIDMVPPEGFGRVWHVPPGTWSDDGAQALCLLESLLEQGAMDGEDFADRLLRWRDHGHLAVDGAVFDCGTTTDAALRMLRERNRVAPGVPAVQCGIKSPLAAGNGSMMRVAPLALWWRGRYDQLMVAARWQSAVTHRARKAIVCSVLLAVWIRLELDGEGGAWDRAVDLVRRTYATEDRAWAQEVDDCAASTWPTGGGYCVDTLQGARWCMARAVEYEEAVRYAIQLGNDTDTTAAVVGAVAGARWGLRNLPPRWLQQLRARDVCDPLIARLVEVRCG